MQDTLNLEELKRDLKPFYEEKKAQAEAEGFQQGDHNLQWFASREEQAKTNAIKQIRKELKRMREVDKIKANKLLAGLEAIEWDHKVEGMKDFDRTIAATSMNYKQEKVTIFEERPLISYMQNLKEVAKTARKGEKKIERKAKKLSESIADCKTDANVILDAVLQNGLTPEQAVQNAMGVQVATEV